MCRERRVRHLRPRGGQHRRLGFGFTLIEVMIVVAVIAILAAVVMPSYKDSLRKARRTDARAALTTIAQLMERFNTERNTYVGASLGSATTDLYKDKTENGYYELRFGTGTEATTATTFVVRARPIGAQEGDPCGTYTLDQNGVRGSTLPVAQCW